MKRTTSKRWRETCEPCGKKQYPTKQAAEHAAMRLILRGNEPVARAAALNVYLCTYGNGFHVGHGSPSKRSQRSV